MSEARTNLTLACPVVVLLGLCLLGARPAWPQTLVRQDCYGHLLTTTDQCGEGGAIQWRLLLNGTTPFGASNWITPLGRCWPLSTTTWNYMVAGWLEARCIYTDGRESSAWQTVTPKLGMAGGCE